MPVPGHLSRCTRRRLRPRLLATSALLLVGAGGAVGAQAQSATQEPATPPAPATISSPATATPSSPATAPAPAPLSSPATPQSAVKPPAPAGTQLAQLETITVTATRRPQPAITVPAAIAVIDLEEILRRQPQSLDDLLRSVPGVEFSGGPRSSAEQPSIRGLGDERVVVRLDGARQNFQSGHRGRTFIDPSLLKQVDVLRGPASTLYGSGALGGVIALTTRDAAEFLPQDQRLGGLLRLGYQSNGNERLGTLILAGLPTDTVGVLGSVTYRQSGNVVTGDDTEIPFSGEEIVTGLLKANAELAPGHEVRVSYQGLNNAQDLPSAPDTTDLSIIVDRDTRQDTGTLGYTGRAGNWLDLVATAYVNRTDIEEDRLDRPRVDETRLRTIGVDVANTAQVTLVPWADLALTTGVEAYQDRQEGTRDGGARPQFPDAESTVVGLFSRAEFRLWDAVTVAPGVRWDRFNQSVEDDSLMGSSDRTESEVSPAVAVDWRAARWITLYASYAEAFRAPSLTELFSSGLHFPGVCPRPPIVCPLPDNFFVPNPNLRPETAHNYEVGVNLDFRALVSPDDRLLAKAAAFHNQVDDLIEQAVLIPLGQTVRRNVVNAEIRGLELELQYESPTWFGGIAGSLLRGEDEDTGEALDDIPADRLVLTAGRYHAPWNLSAGWRTTLTDDQERVRLAQQTPGYAVHDLFVVWEPRADLRLDLGVDNLFDRQYRRHLSSIPERGRAVKVAGALRF